MDRWDIPWGRERIVNVRFRRQIMWRGWEQPISEMDESEDDFEEESDDYDTEDDKKKDIDNDSKVFQDWKLN